MASPLSLPGCTPIPLAGYLKALGILRILSQQCPDSQAKGCWRGNAFLLSSHLDRDAILDFFLHRYAPSPIVAPWNGGSGFYPKDNSTAIDVITSSASEPFAIYRETIAAARTVLASLGCGRDPKRKRRRHCYCAAATPSPNRLWNGSTALLS